MLGSAVSSSTPIDFQPNSQKGVAAKPQIDLHAMAAPPGNPYIAVGTKTAFVTTASDISRTLINTVSGDMD